MKSVFNSTSKQVSSKQVGIDCELHTGMSEHEIQGKMSSEEVLVDLGQEPTLPLLAPEKEVSCMRR